MSAPWSRAQSEKRAEQLGGLLADAADGLLGPGRGPAARSVTSSPSLAVLALGRRLTEAHPQLALLDPGAGDLQPREPGGQREETTIRPHRHDQLVAVARETHLCPGDERQRRGAPRCYRQ